MSLHGKLLQAVNSTSPGAEPAFKDGWGIHDKDGLGSLVKGLGEAREVQGLKIMEGSGLAAGKKESITVKAWLPYCLQIKPQSPMGGKCFCVNIYWKQVSELYKCCVLATMFYVV